MVFNSQKCRFGVTGDLDKNLLVVRVIANKDSKVADPTLTESQHPTADLKCSDSSIIGIGDLKSGVEWVDLAIFFRGSMSV